MATPGDTDRRCAHHTVCLGSTTTSCDLTPNLKSLNNKEGLDVHVCVCVLLCRKQMTTAVIHS